MRRVSPRRPPPNDSPAYTCDVGPLKPGGTRTFEFTALLGEPGTGRLILKDEAPSSAWDRGRRDDDPSDDRAVITVGE